MTGTNNGTNKTLTWIGALALILIFVLAAGNAGAVELQPTVATTSGFQADRDAAGRHDMANAETLVVTTKDLPARAAKSGSATTQSIACCTHYIYDGYTELFDDIDGDGYFTYLRINVDIDTDYFESDIYLKAFVRGSTGPWNRIYTSNVFTINGSSSFDDYEIETELVSGFAPDYYDVLIEVYDAFNGQLVAEYGALENSAFALLPLEDVNRDGAYTLPIVTSYGSSGGGSLSVLGLAFLVTLALARQLRRRVRYAAPRRDRRAP